MREKTYTTLKRLIKPKYDQRVKTEGKNDILKRII